MSCFNQFSVVNEGYWADKFAFYMHFKNQPFAVYLVKPWLWQVKCRMNILLLAWDISFLDLRRANLLGVPSHPKCFYVHIAYATAEHQK